MFEYYIVDQIFRSGWKDQAYETIDDHQEHPERQAKTMLRDQLARIAPGRSRAYPFLWWCAHAVKQSSRREASGRKGAWAKGRVGERASGRVGERASGRKGDRCGLL